MTLYHVKGFSLVRRYPNIQDVIPHLLPGDDVDWHGTAKFTNPIVIKNTTTIEGNNTHHSVLEHQVGFVLDGQGVLTLNDVTIDVARLARAILVKNWKGQIVLNNCNIIYHKSIKKAKPAKIYNIFVFDTLEGFPVSLEMNNCKIDSITVKAGRIKLNETDIGNDYVNSMLEAHTSIISKNATMSNVIFNSDNILMNTIKLKHSINIIGKGTLKNIKPYIDDDMDVCNLNIHGDFKIEDSILNHAIFTMTSSNVTFTNVKGFSELTTNANDTSIILNESSFKVEPSLMGTSSISNRNTSGNISQKSQALEKLDSMIGLDSVKQVMRSYINIARVTRMRQQKGLSTTDTSLHLVFSGNPGTGKTTVARIFAKALYEEGVLPTDKVVNITREGLIDNVIGGTAIKTRKVIERAIGGVLFIDEAYQLRSEGDKDFAAEAVAELVEMMETHRNDLVVILAGYTNEMHDFIDNANVGLKSRFNNWIEFEDYSFDELSQILLNDIYSQFNVSDEITEVLITALADLYQSNKVNGNGRYIRGFVQKIAMAQANRIATDSSADLEALELSDIAIAYKAEKQK